MAARKSEFLKEEEMKLKKLKMEQTAIEKAIKDAEKKEVEKKKKIVKLTTDIEKQDAKLAKKKKTPVGDYEPSDRPWNIHIKGVCETLSGNKPMDIDALVNKPKNEIEKLRLSMLSKQVDIINKTSRPSIEDMNTVSEAINSFQENAAIYACHLMSIHRDNQKLGPDNLPLPCIPQHFHIGAARSAIEYAFGEALGIWTHSSRGAGWLQMDVVAKHFKANPRHIFMYRDKEMTPESIATASDIYIEGQQPTPAVRGFAKDEVLDGPLYFQYTMTIVPTKALPMLTNEMLVFDIIDYAVMFGLGGRRTANYGMWKILDMKKAATEVSSYDKFVRAA
jgi:hypothetical protein